ncbi:MAG: hypothetical protein H6538_08350 [Bacteroidales bacterium]|nr:hypothetical protein [Bacteroidales bacterium]MCB9012925.1 hypothetical protein [Bacteroidales bacterium]
MQYNTRGLAGTILFHLLLLFLLLFFGFSFPDPPPEEQGVLVNFGNSETGLGKFEPKGEEVQASEDEPQPPVEEKVNETAVVPVKQVKQEKVDTKTVQNIEETKVKENKPTAEELRKIELEKKQAEEKRLQEAEAARQKKITDEANNRAKNAFANKGVGTTTGGQGVTEGTGNQGNPDGTPDASNYGDGGGLGNGISFGLGTRGARGSLPLPAVGGCTVTSRVIIKVRINVDPEGNVAGDPSILESNFQDDCIYEAVLKAAASAKFTVDQKAAFRQQGWIRYIIEPR